MLVVQHPHAQVHHRPGHRARLIGGHENRHIGQLRESRQPPPMVLARNHFVELLPRNSVCLGLKPENLLDRLASRDDPVLSRIETNSGHGASSTTKAIAITADVYTFIFYNLGVTPKY